jgi:hypothetical protein
MLGFVLGALFVVALPPMGEDKPASPVPKPVEPPKPTPPAPPQVATIQAVFEDPRWEGIVATMWSRDTTEVALWNSDTRDFTDFFEVRRFGNEYYYRSIPTLTRPLLSNVAGLSKDCPLRFTARPADDLFSEAQIPSSRRDPADEKKWKPSVQTSEAPLPQVTAPPRPTPAPPRIELTPKLPPPEK